MFSLLSMEPGCLAQMLALQESIHLPALTRGDEAQYSRGAESVIPSGARMRLDPV
jgi:hypothetical protein